MSEDNLPVFILLDGKLLPKPGGKRDHARRYAYVAHSDGPYWRELTEAEERERNEEERSWRLEKPKRDAERKRREEEADRFRASLEYQIRVLAFLDVLGWRDAVHRSRDDTELTKSLGVALAGWHAHAQMVEWQQEHGPWPGDPQVTQFSDSIALSYAVTADSAVIATQMESSLHAITQQMLQAGLFVRGAVVQGSLIHRGTMVYGPALIAAIDLEKSAEQPRILLGEGPAESWHWGRGVPVYDLDGTSLGVRTCWRKDSDGQLFFDFLRPWPLDQTNHLHERLLISARRAISDNVAANRRDKKIRKKNLWLASYLSAICREHNITSVAAIQIAPRYRDFLDRIRAALRSRR